MTAPTDPADTRSQVADLVKMKDPANAAYGCTPARFIRAVRAIAPGAGMTGMREAIGETEFEMQQILGYAPIEPDGSFKLTVPADTPIGLAVVNDKGQASPDAHQLDPGPAGRAPHLRRLPQPASRRRHQLRRRRQHGRRRASRRPCQAAHQSGRDDGRHAHAPRPDDAQARQRPDVQRLLGRHDQAGRHRPADDRPQVHRQRRGQPTTSSRPCRPTASSTTRRTSRRCGRATAAPTPAPAATTTPTSST